LNAQNFLREGVIKIGNDRAKGKMALSSESRRAGFAVDQENLGKEWKVWGKICSREGGGRACEKNTLKPDDYDRRAPFHHQERSRSLHDTIIKKPKGRDLSRHKACNAGRGCSRTTGRRIGRFTPFKGRSILKIKSLFKGEYARRSAAIKQTRIRASEASV